MMFEKVCFVGLGLIGASLAQVIRDNNLADTIVASSRSQRTIDDGVSCGLIDIGYLSARQAAQGADIVILAMPVQATRAVLAEIADVIDSHTIITDVGSTKGNVVAAARHVFNRKLPKGFVPAHPIAGAEKSGLHARNPDLFQHHKVIITPLPSTSPDAVQLVKHMWSIAGADVIEMTVERHDDVLARTSHLPHLLAFNLVDQLAGHDDNMDIFRYAAGGFRDFTRIAASDPTMWRDIFYANREAILASIEEFSEHLTHLKSYIENDNTDALMGLLTRAQAARQHFGHMLDKTPYLENQTMSQNFCISPSPNLSPKITGHIRVPGDKSISHRSIMLGSLAQGTTTVTNFLEGEDALATLQAFRDMGVVIEGPTQGRVVIHGVGMQGLQAPPNTLYMGNSGTSMRLLAGILSAQAFDSVMTGDASLSKRPMERVANPLRKMQAKIQTTGERGTPPISIKGGQQLQGIEYAMPIASAQVKSCLMLAAMYAQGTTTVIEPEVTRDHTERMLEAFGYPVDKVGNRISLTGGGTLTATDIHVPADISSAAFFMVAAAISAKSELTIEQVGINATRIGVIDILKMMGADIQLTNQQILGGESVADITVRSSDLRGITIPQTLVPLAIDEFPVLFIAASCAIGETILTGAAELKVKESDRLNVMAQGLQTLGIDCSVSGDGIRIQGKGEKGALPTVFSGGEIQAHHDHRIAMAFSVAGLRASDKVTIIGTETVNTSFPDFALLALQVGMPINVITNAPST